MAAANEFGLDAEGIEAVYRSLQPGAVVAEATDVSGGPVADGQLEVTAAEAVDLARLQQLEAEVNLERRRKVNHGSELHPAVVGHNQSMQRHTQRLVRQWFCEQRYQLDKLLESQRAARRQLVRLHVDRRRQMRENLRHRQEEARLDSERAVEQRRRQEELGKLDRAMAALRAEEEAERRRQIVRLAGGVPLEASTSSLEKLESAEAEVEQIPPLSPVTPQPPWSPLVDDEAEIVTFTSKVLEIDRRSYQAAAAAAAMAAAPLEEILPLIRQRSKSFVREASGLRPVPDVSEGSGELPAVSTDDRPPRRVAARKQVTIVEADRVRRTSLRELEVSLPPPPPPLLPPLAPTPLALTLAERNRRRTRRREEESRRILDEPYQCYRLNKDGSLEPLESQPPRFPTQEPTNHPVYEHHKRLERERMAHRDSMLRLAEHTTAMLRAAEADAAPAGPDRIGWQRSQLNRAAGSAAAAAETFGGGVGGSLAAWASVFVRNELPEGVEPGSFEAMRYIDYIRPDPPQPDRPAGIEHVFSDL